MAVSMPEIFIEFKKAATTMSSRSVLGNVVLLMRDATGTKTITTYKTAAAAQADAAAYTATNAQYIQDAFGGGAAKVVTVRVDEAIADALATVKSNALTGWITVCDGTEADYAALADWAKVQETLRSGHSQYYALVHKVDAPNCRHVINLYTDTVTFADAKRGACAASAFLPTLAGMIASCGVTRSCTYLVCNTLTAVSEIAETEQDATLAAGKLFLIVDGADIRVALGINSCTDKGIDDDFRYIDIVVALDMMYTDIVAIWKDNYCGKYRNTLDNQMLLIAAINSYFHALAVEGILDSNYENVATIDVDTQRTAWITSGKTEAADWTDEELKVKTYRRNVYLAGDIRLMGTMDNIRFIINLD